WYVNRIHPPWAANQLGISYEIGRGVNQDPHKALALYNQAVRAGVCPAANNIAQMYDEPAKGLNQDIYKAYQYALHAKKNGCAFSALLFQLEFLL
ncbi:unnamed protein product, partial [Chrysoparadoxa australica]